MKIGERIRVIREVKNIPQKEMADLLEMTVGGYSKIERGAVNINTEKLNQIAEALGITAADLMSMDETTVFNFTNNEIKNAGNLVFNFPEEMKALYEDKIVLLEEKIKYLEEKIADLKGK